MPQGVKVRVLSVAPMIKLDTYIVSNTSTELETLQPLLASFSSSFIFSIIENDDTEFPYKLLIEIDLSSTNTTSMIDFTGFLLLKIAEVNQAV